MSEYRVVGFERGGTEVTHSVSAEDDADAWTALLPPGFLMLRLEKKVGEEWQPMRIDSARLMREIGSIAERLTTTN